MEYVKLKPPVQETLHIKFLKIVKIFGPRSDLRFTPLAIHTSLEGTDVHQV